MPINVNPLIKELVINKKMRHALGETWERYEDLTQHADYKTPLSEHLDGMRAKGIDSVTTSICTTFKDTLLFKKAFEDINSLSLTGVENLGQELGLKPVIRQIKNYWLFNPLAMNLKTIVKELEKETGVIIKADNLIIWGTPDENTYFFDILVVQGLIARGVTVFNDL